MQVSGTLTSFANSLLSAFRPQIIQNYARREYSYMLTLLNNCSRYSVLLMGLFAVPLIIEAEYVLGLWLGTPPPHTVVFCRLALVAACVEMANSSCLIGIHATGRVVRMSLVSGTFYLAELPLMYWLIIHTGMPAVIYMIHIVMVTGVLFADTMILRRQLDVFSPARFWLRGVALPAVILLMVSLPSAYVSVLLPQGFGRFVAVGFTSTVLLAVFTYMFALDASTRSELRTAVKTKLWKK